MGFEATRLVRFITANVITHRRYFDIVHENVEHLNGIAIGIFHLFGNLAINCGSERAVFLGKNHFQEIGNDFMKVFDGSFFEGAKEGSIDGRLFAFKFKGFFEDSPLPFCPASPYSIMWAATVGSWAMSPSRTSASIP